MSIELTNWLRGLGLEQYASAFHDNAIDAEVVRDLTADDLKDLGVNLVGHRRKLLAAIAALRSDPLSPGTPIASSEPVRSAQQAGVGAGDAERRQLSVMFCDLVGSTELSLRLDPEDLREVISAYQRCVGETIGRFEGFVAKYMGDGVLVYFGYPHAHEDDAERAVRAGLGVIDAVGRLDVKSITLQARIGIATGLVVVGDLIGSGESQERGVVGETPNLAARLQALAAPGAVVIASSTRRLTRGQFDYRDLGGVALKGFGEAVLAWQVMGESAVESRFDAQHGIALIPLVGREEELDLLRRRWRQVEEGEGRVVLLVGEAGIGKSRVTGALLEGLTGEPHLRLRYFCSPHHRDSVLFPVISQLERAAGFAREDTAAQKLAKLEALLARGGPDPEAVNLIADLLSLPERHLLPELTPQQRKQKTLEALLAQLDALAAQQPLLMLFEDVHWIDPTSLELLTSIVERVQRLRVLLLVTARPEFTPPWPGHAHVTVLSLTRLSRREGKILVNSVTGDKALPEEVLERILARTDGVPLFIEELTKTVVESGVLSDSGDRYTIAGPLPPLAIPATLHDSLMARLDRLAPVKDVAQIAACIGRDFDYDLLAAVSGMAEDDLRSALDALRRAELVIARGLPAERYSFKHALVCDAAYAGLLKSRRAQLHATIARAIEQSFADVVEGQPETLAHHLTEAGLPNEAAGFWLRAGKLAAARSANLEAIAHLRRGIDAVAQLRSGSATARLELDLQLTLGPCLIATEGAMSGASVATFTRARALCEQLGDVPEYVQVMHWLNVMHAIRGELHEALDASTTAVVLAKGNRPAAVNAMRGRGLVLLLMGRLVEARQMIERDIEVFEACDESERLATRAAGQDAGVAGMAVMAWIQWALGHSDTARANIAAALQRAGAIGHPHTQAYASYYASVLHALCRDPAAAHTHAEHCLRLSEEHGFGQWRNLSRAVGSICANLLDPAVDSLGAVRIELDDYVGTGYQFGITALYVLLSQALLTRRQLAPARQVIKTGLATAGRTSEQMFEAELLRLKARALALDAEPDGTTNPEALLEEALTTARSQNSRSLELRAALDLTDIWREKGRCIEARELLAPVYGWFTEGFATPDLEEAKALLDALK